MTAMYCCIIPSHFYHVIDIGCCKPTELQHYTVEVTAEPPLSQFVGVAPRSTSSPQAKTRCERVTPVTARPQVPSPPHEQPAVGPQWLDSPKPPSKSNHTAPPARPPAALLWQPQPHDTVPPPPLQPHAVWAWGRQVGGACDSSGVYTVTSLVLSGVRMMSSYCTQVNRSSSFIIIIVITVARTMVETQQPACFAPAWTGAANHVASQLPAAQSGCLHWGPWTPQRAWSHPQRLACLQGPRHPAPGWVPPLGWQVPRRRAGQPPHGLRRGGGGKANQGC